MTNKKRIGVWMDHAAAHLMEFTTDPIAIVKIESSFTHQAKEDSLEKSEHLMHNKEQMDQLAYYKQLAGLLKDCAEVLLFGPTDAKTELFNFLKKDRHFAAVKVDLRSSGKLTDNQQQAFVREHFSGKSGGL